MKFIRQMLNKKRPNELAINIALLSSPHFYTSVTVLRKG